MQQLERHQGWVPGVTLQASCKKGLGFRVVSDEELINHPKPLTWDVFPWNSQS